MITSFISFEILAYQIDNIITTEIDIIIIFNNLNIYLVLHLFDTAEF